MVQYLDLLRHVLEHGKFKADRTGTGTFSVFGAQARFPLQKNFPALTTKKLRRFVLQTMDSNERFCDR